MDDLNDGVSPPPNTSLPRQAHGLHLACRECQRKKIKCDRNFPCGRCTRSGLACVPSSRKPRAKVGSKGVDAELRQRIAKLEKLVETFQGDEDGSGIPGLLESKTTPSSEPHAEPRGAISNENSGRFSNDSPQSHLSDGSSPHSNKASKYIAGNFWSSLTSEVKALADAFEEDGFESDEDALSPELSNQNSPHALDPTQSGISGYELIFCPPGALYVIPGAVQEPGPAFAGDLLSYFLKYVEPCHKLFHIPTLLDLMQNGAPYLGKPADAPCNKALRASIFFAGVSAVTNDECVAKYGKSLDQLVQEYRRTVDIALYQADILNTNDLATLQALLLYAASIRVYDSSRRAWSLVGLLVRIAQALNIHRELPGESPFLAELKRRLWYNIIFVDCHASLDRGSESALDPKSFTRLRPSNCNDLEFSETSPAIPNRDNELTDMSAALLAQEGALASMSIALPGQTWQRRLELSYEFQRKANEKYLRHCNPALPFHKLMIGTGAAISHSMILRAVRPMVHDTATSSSPPRVNSPWVMQLALNLLRHAAELWEFHASQWRTMPWVPWHAIAVALAGLCSVRDTELAREAWQLVEQSMERYARDVADTKNGMLWRPIEKLYKKASAFRDSSASAVAPPNSVPLLPLDDAFDLGGVDADSVFDFPPELQAALPNDTSWLDWEAMMRDMDELKSEEMQWM